MALCIRLGALGGVGPAQGPIWVYRGCCGADPCIQGWSVATRTYPVTSSLPPGPISLFLSLSTAKEASWELKQRQQQKEVWMELLFSPLPLWVPITSGFCCFPSQRSDSLVTYVFQTTSRLQYFFRTQHCERALERILRVVLSSWLFYAHIKTKSTPPST